MAKEPFGSLAEMMLTYGEVGDFIDALVEKGARPDDLAKAVEKHRLKGVSRAEIVRMLFEAEKQPGADEPETLPLPKLMEQRDWFRRWLEDHGSLEDYLRNYGSARHPKHYGLGGEVIYAADVRCLRSFEERYEKAAALVLDKPIYDLGLSIRCRRCLAKMGVQTIKDLVQKNEDDLARQSNFGPISLDEIRQKLGEVGLALQPRLPPRVRMVMGKMNIQNLEGLAEKTERELMMWQGFGKGSLEDVKKRLASLGLSLRPKEQT